MNAKLFFGSGKSERGQRMGCVEGQFFVTITDVSCKDASGCNPDLYVSGPHNDEEVARADAMAWAVANGIEIVGDHRPRLITGASADARANR